MSFYSINKEVSDVVLLDFLIALIHPHLGVRSVRYTSAAVNLDEHDDDTHCINKYILKVTSGIEMPRMSPRLAEDRELLSLVKPLLVVET